MRDRWQHDLDKLSGAYPDVNWEWDNPEVEVQRNLATAIAQIEFMLVARATPKDSHPCK